MNTFLLLGNSAPRAARSWPLALALYVPSAILAFIAGTPFFLGLEALAASGTLLARAATGDVVLVVLEVGLAVLAAPSGTPPAAVRALGVGSGVSVALLGAAVLVQGCLYNLVAGGVMHSLGVSSDARGFSWTVARGWFWPMLRLGFEGVLALGTGAAVVVAVVAVLPLGAWAAPVSAVALLGWLALGNGWLELARAELVHGGTRSAWRSIGRAGLRLVQSRAHMGSLVAAWLLLGLTAVLYWSLVGPLAAVVPASAVLGSALAQQAALIGSAWLKLLRLALAVEVVLHAPAGRRYRERVRPGEGAAVL
ncbi:MAG: hypothetical protein HYX52_06855 [Chloroflexi bacterium]|nr:hypothetical protein [Chloroflexota bacterium]